MREKLFRIVQYLVLVAAWAYLIYRLATYEDYSTLLYSIRQCGWIEWLCFAGALLLIFPNILAEAWKWQTLTEDIEPITLREAWWQVCYGQLTAFVTPYRVGDYPGRVWISAKCRVQSARCKVESAKWKGTRMIAQGYLGSVLLTAVIVMVGLPFVIDHWTTYHLPFYIYYPAVVIGLLLASSSPLVKLYKPLMQSMVRYLVWMLQLWLLLRWVGIGLSPLTALSSVASYYLLVTLTPSMPAADAAVRGSWMLVVMSQYGADEASAAVVAMGMWALNIIIPMFFGIFAEKNLRMSK